MTLFSMLERENIDSYDKMVKKICKMSLYILISLPNRRYWICGCGRRITLPIGLDFLPIPIDVPMLS